MDWVRAEELGRGSFSKVNLAVPRSLMTPLMAVKSCGVLHFSSLMNEKLILEELKDCPQVVDCFGQSFTNENGENLCNVLLEYASVGSMADKIKNSGDQRLPEYEIRRYTKALLKGLHYIHKFGYVHCDIKLQNILLCGDGTVKIADFGLAKRAGEGKGCSSRWELRGTPLYMSPEVVTGGEQGAPADIWALGCVVAEMITGTPAWKRTGMAALLLKIGVGEVLPEVPRSLSDDGKDFLGKMFVKDPVKRWTAEMLLEHPFVSGDQFCEENKRAINSSPRCPFDFPDWGSSLTCSITCLPPSEYSPESDYPFKVQTDRLWGIMSHQNPDWIAYDWITVR